MVGNWVHEWFGSLWSRRKERYWGNTIGCNYLININQLCFFLYCTFPFLLPRLIWGLERDGVVDRGTGGDVKGTNLWEDAFLLLVVCNVFASSHGIYPLINRSICWPAQDKWLLPAEASPKFWCKAQAQERRLLILLAEWAGYSWLFVQLSNMFIWGEYRKEFEEFCSNGS